MACGLNFIDVYQRTGLYANPLPLTLGMEGAGIVEAVGEGVTHLQAGDRAAYASNPPGSYSQVRVMPAKTVCRLPDAIDFDTGAGMMLKGLTAQYLLKKTLPVQGLQPGDHVLFHAAAGGVGLIACQWAKALGLQLIGTAGGAAKCALALEHGAAHAIDYTKEDFVARVKDITGGQGVKVVYDSIGKDTFEGSLDCLRPFGLMASFGNASGPVPPFALGSLGAQGLAVPDAADAVHAHRHARVHAGHGRRAVRGGGQRRRSRSASTSVIRWPTRRRRTATWKRARPRARPCCCLNGQRRRALETKPPLQAAAAVADGEARCFRAG